MPSQAETGQTVSVRAPDRGSPVRAHRGAKVAVPARPLYPGLCSPDWTRTNNPAIASSHLAEARRTVPYLLSEHCVRGAVATPAGPCIPLLTVILCG